MKFNTQICTTREQSERLLALGLKKETADCFIWHCDNKDYTALNSPDSLVEERKGDIYAWSLHRLMELCPKSIHLDDYADTHYYLRTTPGEVLYQRDDKTWLRIFDTGNIYDRMVDMIEWLIKNNYFNKEYLEE